MGEFKNKIRIMLKKRKVILIILIVYLILIFYVGDKFYTRKSISNDTMHNDTVNNKIVPNNTVKEAVPKPSADANMNLRESKVNTEGASKNSSTIDVYKSDGRKIAYLTFDDGPSIKITPQILKILDYYYIKATFFIIGKLAIGNPNIVKMEVEDGQSIGNHTYSHDYKYIYSNANAFISDVNKCDAALKSIIGSGYKSKLLRFPGGSFGARREALREVIQNEGYYYIDWNDLTGDAEGQNIPVNTLLNNLKKYTKGKEHVIVLMHDSSDKETTVEALPQVIEYLQGEGYSFKTLK